MSSSSSSATQGEEDAGPSYTEIEVRASFTEARKYYNALFPQAPKPAKDEKRTPYPAFGTKEFPPPVRLREEDVVEQVSDDSEEEDVPRYKKRRHVYYSRTDKRWVLSGKRGKNVLHGSVEGQGGRYFVMIPPLQNEEHFQIVPVEKWVEFKKPLNYKPLTAHEARAMEESKSSMNKISEFMEERQRKMKEDQEVEGSRNVLRKGEEPRGKSSKKKVKREDGQYEIDFENADKLLESDDDAEITTNTKTRRKGQAVEENIEKENEDEDIDVRAIDRLGGGGDIDYQEPFEDDEDDGALIQEEEQIVANETSLIQGAEEVREALTDDSDDDSGDEEEEGEPDENVGAYQHDMEALLERTKNRGEDDEDDDLERQRFLNSTFYRAKVVKENDDVDTPTAAGNGAVENAESKPNGTEPGSSAPGGVPGSAAASATDANAKKRPAESGVSSSSSGAPVRKKAKAKTPLDLFKDRVIDAIRQNGGTMDIGKLFKVVTKKKLLKTVGMKKSEANQHLSPIVKDVADISEDKITGSMQATLKQKYV